MRYLQLYIFLLAVCILSSHRLGATSDSLGILKKADSLSNAGEHYLSSIFYRKALFFETDPADRAYLALRAAEQLKHVQRFGEGVELLSLVKTHSLSDSLIFKVKYQAALLSYLASDFGACENYLIQIKYLLKDTSRVYDTYLLHAFSFNEQFRWSEAQQKLNSLIDSNKATSDSTRKARRDLVQTLYDPDSLPRIKNKRKAVRMSTFIPGLGQTYAGYPGEGAVSMGALLVTSGAMVIGIINQYYFTSIVLGNVVFGKFYQGGITRTEFLVDKRNYLRTKKFNEDLKKRLIAGFGK